MILGLIVLLVLVAGGAAAALANISLSNTYSPEKAVTDYLAAQKRGDFFFMFNNANYLRGAGAVDQLFDEEGLGGYLTNPQNAEISDVRVTSTVEVDADTRIVSVTMTWAGHHLMRAFKLHRDLTRVHYRFYNSWRIDIPFASIHITAPNQHGSLFVDGVTVPESAINDIRVIPGFHKVTMDSNDLYDTISLDADTVDGDASAAFRGAISRTGLALAAIDVNEAFLVCNAKKWFDCPNHLYHAPNRPGYTYFWTLPGYPRIDHATYKFTLTSAATLNPKLVVSAASSKIAINGGCRFTLTINGSQRYFFKGTWTGTLDVTGGLMNYATIAFRCHKAKA